jgi:hypothetical protein
MQTRHSSCKEQQIHQFEGIITIFEDLQQNDKGKNI